MKNSKKKYVLGFLFSGDEHQVALILKKRPLWQKGLFNGIGGKVEDGETFEEAMEREFGEETGVKIEKELWKHFTTIVAEDYEVKCYKYSCNKVYDVVTKTDEEVHIMPVSYLSYGDNVIFNLKWLIPMALDYNYGKEYTN